MKKALLFSVILTLFIYFKNHAQIDFQNHVIIDQTSSIIGPQVVLSADLDGDGDQDLVICGNRIIGWYENTDGQGKFAVLKVITSETYYAPAMQVADLDGDGDLDVLFTDASNSNMVGWHENIDGLGNFGPLRIITDESDRESVFSADLDGDNDLDVISAGGNIVEWYENLDGLGNFGSPQVLTFIAESARAVSAADVDGDGDTDILLADYGNLHLSWFENTNGQGDFGLPQTISSERNVRVYPADIDDDGDMDIVSTVSNTIPGIHETVWFENTDGLGTFGPKHIISTPTGGTAYLIDIDGDGDIDILRNVPSESIVWHENTDGLGTFGPEQIITELFVSIRSVYASDLDGDGDIDVFSTSFGDFSLAWYENTDGLGDFGDRTIVSSRVEDAFVVCAADIDGDNDIDVLSASFNDDKIAWYENADGQGDFRFAYYITVSFGGPNSIRTEDMDGDGDIDVLASSSGGKIGWYENMNGQGHFSNLRAISINSGDYHPTSVYAVDIDGDSDLDVIATFYSFSTGDIIWYENLDGLGNFGGPNIITTQANGGRSVFASDLDGDGDMDVLSASLFDDKIAWYENTDGLGNFGAQQIISSNANGAFSVYAADLDNDGDKDVMAALFDADEIVWYENTDGEGTFGSEQTITTNANGASSVYAADLDDDGDLDVISASHDDDKVAYYINTDGLGTFGPQRIITANRAGANSVFAADINGDNKMDVLSANRYGASIDWYENRGPLGINENEISSLTLYPNPTDGILNIASETTIISVSIYNQLGQLVLEKDNDEGVKFINMRKLSNGLYFVKLIDTASKSDVKTVILN